MILWKHDPETGPVHAALREAGHAPDCSKAKIAAEALRALQKNYRNAELSCVLGTAIEEMEDAARGTVHPSITACRVIDYLHGRLEQALEAARAEMCPPPLTFRDWQGRTVPVGDDMSQYLRSEAARRGVSVEALYDLMVAEKRSI